MKPEDGDGRFFYALTDSTDFERRWPRILASKPDFIKVILVYSEEHARRANDPALNCFDFNKPPRPFHHIKAPVSTDFFMHQINNGQPPDYE